MIGNYGINSEDNESDRPQARAFVVRESVSNYSNWRAEESLDGWLKRHNIVGISEIDTRALTKILRLAGSMRGIVSTVDLDPKSLVDKAERAPELLGQDLVLGVTAKTPVVWSKKGTYRVVALDYGIKRNILRLLEKEGCAVRVVPANTPANEILDLEPDGIFLSNGPGDPIEASYAARTIKDLLGKRPIFGICLGHQLLASALGAKTYKLKFGHRGANQPVKNLRTGRVEITSQNHGYAVDADTLPASASQTHLNLNDGTNEGLTCPEALAFSVQYHPEAAPGPHDSRYLFKEFTQAMKNGVS